MKKLVLSILLPFALFAADDSKQQGHLVIPMSLPAADDSDQPKKLVLPTMKNTKYYKDSIWDPSNISLANHKLAIPLVIENEDPTDTSVRQAILDRVSKCNEKAATNITKLYAVYFLTLKPSMKNHDEVMVGFPMSKEILSLVAQESTYTSFLSSTPQILREEKIVALSSLLISSQLYRAKSSTYYTPCEGTYSPFGVRKSCMEYDLKPMADTNLNMELKRLLNDLLELNRKDPSVRSVPLSVNYLTTQIK